MIEDVNSLADMQVSFDVMEGGTAVGSLQIPLPDFMEEPIRRKLYPISGDERATITVSAKVAFA